MIGYYVHHQGYGHVRRALAIAGHVTEPMTGLSSLPRPDGWPGQWVRLPLDHDPGPGTDGQGPGGPAFRDAGAGGRLHWAPLGHAGLRTRMALLSTWIEQARPELLVSDVSVEVALLVRLHGIRVASFVQPGRRGDAPHVLGHEVSSLLLAPWPDGAHGMLSDVSPDVARKIVAVGAISITPVADPEPPRTAGTVPRVLVLGGRGGHGLGAAVLARARRETPGWHWDVLGGVAGAWVADPRELIRRASVVVTHAGLSALADVSAARRPAIVIPDDRPHDEQRHTARHLASAEGYPVLVRRPAPQRGWADLLTRAAALDGGLWARWNDGGGARHRRSGRRTRCRGDRGAVTTAVVTIVHGRHDHLDRQRAALALSTVPPDEHVVVAMGDPGVAGRVGADGLRTRVLEMPLADSALPLAAARNLGARAALSAGAKALVFLDVDCLPGPDLVEAYARAARAPEHRDLLLCGPVTYLDQPPPHGYDVTRLEAYDDPHPARPAPAPGRVQLGGSHELFWSLSFALSAPTWRLLGGFHEAYRGYGGEDTDFAQVARSRRVDLGWVGSARAYHQYHPTASPPVQHLNDILRNGAIYRRRWGYWPMSGWLESFERMGLVGRVAATGDWHRID